jgi:hypothetical protein
MVLYEALLACASAPNLDFQNRRKIACTHMNKEISFAQ